MIQGYNFVHIKPNVAIKKFFFRLKSFIALNNITTPHVTPVYISLYIQPPYITHDVFNAKSTQVSILNFIFQKDKNLF